MMYTMPKNLLSICVNFALATQPSNKSFYTSESVMTLNSIQSGVAET